MKKPLILVTVSTERMDDTPIVRLNREYVNALVKAGGVPVPVTNRFGLDELIDHAEIRFAFQDENGAWKSNARGFIRVTIEDAEGRQAWSKALPLEGLL